MKKIYLSAIFLGMGVFSFGQNTLLGTNAGANTTGTKNSYIGYYAGFSNTTGNYNSFLGHLAGYENTTGHHNHFSGSYAGYSNTTGFYNNFIGYRSGYANTEGDYNNFVGTYAGYGNLSGNYNNFVGYKSGYNNTTGITNSYFGTYAGYNNQSGNRNVFLGPFAGYNETGSSRLYIANKANTPLIYGEFDNERVGIGTKLPTATLDIDGNLRIRGGNPGAGKVLVSDGIGQASWGVPNVADADADPVNELQNLSLNGTQLAISDGIGIDLAPIQDGTGTDDQNISGSGLFGTDLTIGIEGGASEVVDLSSLQDGTGTDDQTISLVDNTLSIEDGNSVDLSLLQDGIGTDDQNISGSGLSGKELTIGIENGNSEIVNLAPLVYGIDLTSGHSFIGIGAGNSSNTGNFNSFFGYHAGNSNLDGAQNTFIGYSAGRVNTTGHFNTFVGYRSGYSNVTGVSNTFVGEQAGKSNTSGQSNNFIGDRAGYFNLTGVSNTFVGSDAGYSNTAGDNNNFSGYRSGYLNTTGYNNNFYGYSSGYSNTTGGRNNFIGHKSGYSNLDADNNNFVGYYAGYGNTTGMANTYIGNYSGYNNQIGSGNVFLGQKAGYNELASNKLYIDNSDTETPLIYGEFDTNLLNVNGALHVTEGIALGNTANTANGTMRWTGTDFEGRKGDEWVSLTSGQGGGNSPWTAQDDDVFYNTGKVGIGTTDMPGDYKLYVEDGILAEKVKVAVSGSENWSDYVFENNYRLRPLAEVEAFVWENKHLPGVPSAEEVVREGIDVAQMDAKLLEKIEELTLYMIEMKKEVEILKKENISLKSSLTNHKN